MEDIGMPKMGILLTNGLRTVRLYLMMSPID